MDGAPVAQAVKILDDHMEAVRALYPKEYAAIVNSINALKEADGD